MLESGLALVACCLPILNALGRLPALQSITRSVRRMTSLMSSRQRSQESSKRSHGTTLPNFKRSEYGSVGSQVAIMPDHTLSTNFDVYAMGDVPRIRHEGHETAQAKIWVDRTLEQSESVV